jgi:hypothetical protein
MFKRLYRILMYVASSPDTPYILLITLLLPRAAVIAIGGFFIISTISLSDRQSEDYAPRNWQYRWAS